MGRAAPRICAGHGREVSGSCPYGQQPASNGAVVPSIGAGHGMPCPYENILCGRSKWMAADSQEFAPDTIYRAPTRRNPHQMARWCQASAPGTLPTLRDRAATKQPVLPGLRLLRCFALVPGAGCGAAGDRRASCRRPTLVRWRPRRRESSAAGRWQCWERRA